MEKERIGQRVYVLPRLVVWALRLLVFALGIATVTDGARSITTSAEAEQRSSTKADSQPKTLAPNDATQSCTNSLDMNFSSNPDVISRQISRTQLTSPSGCVPAWGTMPGATVQPTPNTLWGVEAVSSNDVWTVGWLGYGGTGSGGGVITHWDGSQWSTIYPMQGQGGRLKGIDAVSSNDIWAVGWLDLPNTDNEALILHWDGSTWTRSPAPDLGARITSLNAVAAISANDVWAVGSHTSDTGGPSGTLTLHWDGVTWTYVPNPYPGGGDPSLYGVSGSASNDVWAVGSYSPSGVPSHTFSFHWDGSAWSLFLTPNSSVGNTELLDVASVAPGDAWAVGTYQYASASYRTLIIHWDGTAWSEVPAPTGGTAAAFEAVTALSASDIWAVGSGGSLPFIAHWDGSVWSQVPAPDPVQADTTALRAISAVSPTDIWASGSFTVMVRYTGLCASPTPTSTSTPAPPTATPTPCTSGIFSDVPPDNPFYPSVTCLTNGGIISGYADCTFRPGNGVTRGQIAKMVSNAANINDDPGPQIFEDVDPASTFFVLINRLANRGFMGGYPCGGDGEPCGGSNLPYFRPFASATRGQLVKIVSNAAGLGGAPTGLFYTDVPEDHPFYVWIMRLTEIGVMSGYLCGSIPEEPCDEANRPYFRPSANVTRGQASKIVANTFYPNCQTPAARR